MNRRTLLVAGFALVIFLAAGVAFLATRHHQAPAQTEPRPVISESPTPTPHPDEILIRRLVTEFIPKWGSFSYDQFPAYQASVTPLITPALSNATFGPETLPYRIRSLTREQYRATSKINSIESVSFNGDGVVVRIRVDESITNRDGHHDDTADYEVTYIKQGTLYKVDKVVVEK